jgi:hypothetical protein
MIMRAFYVSMAIWRARTKPPLYTRPPYAANLDNKAMSLCDTVGRERSGGFHTKCRHL